MAQARHIREGLAAQGQHNGGKTLAAVSLPSLLLRGALAGFVGTLPMTAFMLLVKQFLPKWLQYALPPRELADDMEDSLGIGKHLNTTERIAIAAVLHFGYGMATGALYTLLMHRIRLFPPLKGILYGLAVWVGSYAGWMELLRLREAASHQPIRRNLLMLAAHIIWGAATGWLAHILNRHFL